MFDWWTISFTTMTPNMEVSNPGGTLAPVSRRKAFFWLFCILLAAFSSILFATKPQSPDGRYIASYKIALTGDYYYEFANGKVSFVSDGKLGKPMHRNPEGTYFKTKDGWFWLPTDSNGKTYPPVRLSVSWVGITISDYGEFMQRRVINGRRSEWMLDHLPWCIQ